MGSGETISQEQLNEAVVETQTELAKIGLWNEGGRLLECQVIWCALPQITMPKALGFFIHETSLWVPSFLGYAAGHMYIPRWVLLSNGGTCSLRDILRHEYGHAVAHYYPAMIQRSKRFSETFMLYVKHKGKKPAKFKSEAITRKWQFVADLVARIAAGAAKW